MSDQGGHMSGASIHRGGPPQLSVEQLTAEIERRLDAMPLYKPE